MRRSAGLGLCVALAVMAAGCEKQSVRRASSDLDDDDDDDTIEVERADARPQPRDTATESAPVPDAGGPKDGSLASGDARPDTAAVEDAAVANDGKATAMDAGQKADGNGGPSFSVVYGTIFSSRCGSDGECHDRSNGSGDLGMSDQAEAYLNLVGKDSGCAGKKRVEAGKPGSSVLVLILKGAVKDCPARATRMPSGRNALSASQIKLIEDWIAAGANP